MSRVRLGILATLAAAVLLGAGPVGWAIEYQLQELSFPDGITRGSLQGVSARGMAVGMWSSDGIYWWNGAWTLASSPGTGKSVRDVNMQGTLVGYRTATDYRPTTWSVGAGPTGDIPGFDTWGEARGINGRGLIVGYCYPTNGFSSSKRPFLYNPTGSGPASQFLPILDVGGNGVEYDQAVAYAINNNNVVTGWATDISTAKMQLFLWDETNGVRGIGPVVTHGISPWDISDAGHVVGEIGYAGGGFLINPDGSYVALNQKGVGVNSSGMVVCESTTFYYDGASSNINSLIPDPKGYTVGSMAGINNLGTIFGTAQRSDGTWVPVMLNPVVGADVVTGGSCSDLGDWSVSSTGTVNVVADPSDGTNDVIEMITGSPVSIAQLVDTPAGGALLAFDYWFQTTTGTLEVLLDGQSLLTLDAPATVASDWTPGGLIVDDPALLGRQGVVLEFLLDDAGLPGDASIYVDNISLGQVNQAQDVPEPATLALVGMGLLGMIATRRRT